MPKAKSKTKLGRNKYAQISAGACVHRAPMIDFDLLVGADNHGTLLDVLIVGPAKKPDTDKAHKGFWDVHLLLFEGDEGRLEHCSSKMLKNVAASKPDAFEEPDDLHAAIAKASAAILPEPAVPGDVPNDMPPHGAADDDADAAPVAAPAEAAAPAAAAAPDAAADDGTAAVAEAGGAEEGQEGEQDHLEVICPEGHSAGQTITVRTSNGDVDVEIPEGIEAGDKWTFCVPAGSMAPSPPAAPAPAPALRRSPRGISPASRTGASLNVNRAALFSPSPAPDGVAAMGIGDSVEKKGITWTRVDPNSVDIEGRSELPVLTASMLNWDIDCTKLSAKDFDEWCRLLELLWIGDMQEQCDKANEAAGRTDLGFAFSSGARRFKKITKVEWRMFVFYHWLPVLFKTRGIRNLWKETASGIRPAPNLGRFGMGRNRFSDLRQLFVYAVSPRSEWTKDEKTWVSAPTSFQM